MGLLTLSLVQLTLLSDTALYAMPLTFVPSKRGAFLSIIIKPQTIGGL